MSDISLYNILTKVGASPDEAKEAVAEVASAKDMATKADIEKLKMATTADIEKLKAENKANLATLETRLIRQMYAVAGIVIAAVSFIIKVL